MLLIKPETPLSLVAEASDRHHTLFHHPLLSEQVPLMSAEVEPSEKSTPACSLYGHVQREVLLAESLHKKEGV